MVSILERLETLNIYKEQDRAEWEKQLKALLDEISSNGIDNKKDEKEILSNFITIIHINKPSEKLVDEIMNVLAEKGVIERLSAKELYDWLRKSELSYVNGKLIKKVQNINKRDEDGNTVLHIAANDANIGAIKLLVESKADLNIVDANGMTAVAILVGRTGSSHVPFSRIEKCINLLIENGADPNRMDNSGRYPLDYLIGNVSLTKVVEELLNCGICMLGTEEGVPGCMYQVLYNSENYLNFHIERNFKLAENEGLNDEDINALRNRYQEVKKESSSDDKLKKLQDIYDSLEKRVEKIQSKISNKEKYEVMARQIKDKSTKCFSLPKNMDINITDEYTGNSLLHLAVRYKNLLAVKFLVAQGINVELKNNMGRTALLISATLLISAINKNEAKEKELLEAKKEEKLLKDIEKELLKTKEEKKLLEDIERELLKAKAKTNTKDRYGFTYEGIRSNKKTDKLTDVKVKGTWYTRVKNFFRGI